MPHRLRPHDSRRCCASDTLGDKFRGPALIIMGTTCVRCAQPAEGVLCEPCRARLRILLSARAGVRSSAGPSMHWLSAGLAMLTLLFVVGGTLRQATSSPGPTRASQGVWQILGGAGFISPVGLAADRSGNLYVVDGASYHIYKPSAAAAARLASSIDRPRLPSTRSAMSMSPTRPIAGSSNCRRRACPWAPGVRSAVDLVSSTARGEWP